MEEKERGTEEMKKAFGIAREIMIGMLILMLMIGIWLGSVLQTSYRLCPVSAEELQMEVIGK